jgi:hypothetical protein
VTIYFEYDRNQFDYNEIMILSESVAETSVEIVPGSFKAYIDDDEITDTVLKSGSNIFAVYAVNPPQTIEDLVIGNGLPSKITYELSDSPSSGDQIKGKVSFFQKGGEFVIDSNPYRDPACTDPDSCDMPLVCNFDQVCNEIENQEALCTDCEDEDACDLSNIDCTNPACALELECESNLAPELTQFDTDSDGKFDLPEVMGVLSKLKSGEITDVQEVMEVIRLFMS